MKKGVQFPDSSVTLWGDRNYILVRTNKLTSACLRRQLRLFKNVKTLKYDMKEMKAIKIPIPQAVKIRDTKYSNTINKKQLKASSPPHFLSLLLVWRNRHIKKAHITHRLEASC